MPQLLNRETLQLEEIPDELVGDALASGGYAIERDAQVRAINQEGQPVYISGAEAPEAFALGGYRYESAAQEAARKQQEQYGDRDAAAFAAGAARGLSFGLSDQALTKTGLVAPETLAGLKEANPNVSLAGEVVGTAAPMILSGGSSLLAKGATKAGAGVLGVAKAGSAVEAGVAGLLGAEAATSLAGKIATTAISKAAGSAVEGAFYGAGQLISEQALGRPDLNAEKVMAHIGLSALVGGAVGGGLGAGEELLKASVRTAAAKTERIGVRIQETSESWKESWLRKHTSASKSRTTTTTTSTPTGSVSAGIDALKDSAKGSIDDALSALRQKTDDVPELAASANSMTARELVDALTVTPKKHEELSQKIVQALRNVDDATETASRQATNATRKAETRALLQQVNPTGAADDAVRITGELRDAIKRMQAEPDVYAAKGLIKKLETLTDGVEEKLVNGGMDDAAAIFETLDDFKARIDKHTKLFERAPNPEYAETVEVLKGLRGRVKDHLENAALYGEGGSRQAAYNEALATYLPARKEFFRKFGEKKLVKGRPVWELSEVKINTYLRQIGSARGEGRANLVQSYLDAADALNRQIGTSSRIAGEAFDEAAALGVVNAARTMNATAREQLELVSQLRAVDPFRPLADLADYSPVPGTRTVLSFVDKARNPVTQMKGIAALERAGQTIEKMAQLAKMERATKTVTDKIESSVSRYLFKGVRTGKRTVSESIKETATQTAEDALQATAPDKRARRLATPMALEVLERVRFGAPRAMRTQDERQEDRKVAAYRARLTELAEAAADPQALAQRLAKNVGPLADVAPRTSAQLTARAVAAAKFLHERAPKPPASFDTATPLRRRDSWRPSSGDLQKWERYVAAVEDPMSVLDDLEAGRLAPESVDALRAIYPQLYAEIVQTVAKQFDQLGADPSYAKRLQLSLLLGAPFDETMRPAFVATMQQSYAMEVQAPEQQAGAVKPTAAGMSKLTVADKAKTSSERVLSR